MLNENIFKYILLLLGIFFTILTSKPLYIKAIETQKIDNNNQNTTTHSENIALSRSEQLAVLQTEVHENNIQLKNKEVLTTDKLQSKNLDEQTIKMLINIEKTILITKIRYTTNTETLMSLLKRVNTNIDERENFGFNVKLEISKLENIKKELINSYLLLEQLEFNLSDKDDNFTLRDITAELERNKNISKVLLSKHVEAKYDILQLIQLIQDAR